MPRRAGQQVVAERWIVVEAEIVERVGDIEPELVGPSPSYEDVPENRGACARLDALVHGAVGVGDVAIAERAVETLQFVAGCWRDRR